MKISALVPALIALLVGICGGYFVGKGQSGDPSSASASSSGAGGRSSLSGIPGKADDAKKEAATEAELIAGGLDASASLTQRALKLMESGDTALAFKEIFNEPGQIERMEALMNLVKGMDAKGIEAAMAEVRGMPRGMDMFMAANLLTARYAEIDPKAALGFVSEAGGMERMMGTGSILRSWAAKDPKAAGEYVTGTILEEGSQDGWALQRTIGSVASEWAKSDPEAALAWAKSLPEDVSGNALESVIEHFTSQDPEKAAEVAMGLEGDKKIEALQSIADQWSRTDPEAAVAWAEGLEGDARDRALEEALQGLAYKDPAAAVDYLANTITDAEERDSLLPDVASRWARKDANSAAEAAEWLTTQADGDGRARATGEVMGSWMDSDAAAASAWLDSQPAGASKDQGIVAMLRENELREEPGTAVAWADSITDETLRGEQVMAASRNWLKEDRQAATEYIESSASLSAEQKQTLVNLTDEQLNQRNDWRRRFR